MSLCISTIAFQSFCASSLISPRAPSEDFAATMRCPSSSSLLLLSAIGSWLMSLSAIGDVLALHGAASQRSLGRGALHFVKKRRPAPPSGVYFALPQCLC